MKRILPLLLLFCLVCSISYAQIIRGNGSSLQRTGLPSSMSVDSNGNIGINTISPAATLEVNGKLMVDDAVYVNGGTSWQGSKLNILSSADPFCGTYCPPYNLGSAANISYVYPNRSADVIWSIRGHVKNTTSGAPGGGSHSVGVGGIAEDTATGGAGLIGVEGRVDAYGTSGTYSGVMGLISSSNAAGAGLYRGVYSNVFGTNNGTNVAFYAEPITSGATQYSFWGSNKLVLDTANAAIGIGTTVPASQLHMKYDTSTVYSTTVGTTPSVFLENSNQTDGSFTTISMGMSNSSGTGVSIARFAGISTNHTAGSEAGDLAILTKTAGAYGERIRVTGSGNVGIGTTVPVSALQVGSGTAPTKVNDTNDLFVKDAIEADGNIYVDGSLYPAVFTGSNIGAIPCNYGGRLGICATLSGAVCTVCNAS